MGEEGLVHGMTPAQQKRSRELEKENQLLKELLAEKEHENRLKGDLLKPKYDLGKRRKLYPGPFSKA